MKTGVTDGKSGIIWYWVEDPGYQPFDIKQARKRWCRDHFGLLWQFSTTRWYFTKEKDRMLFILTWL